MSGYARIHRTLFGHPAFRSDAEALAFGWMIVKAAWRPTRVRYKDRIISIQRGQLAISQRDMARSMERDKAWVERLWKRLKTEGMIDTRLEAGVTIVSICSYEKYQADAPEGEAPVRQQTPRPRRTSQAVTEADSEAVIKSATNGKHDENGGISPEGEALGEAPDEAANEAGVRQSRATEQEREKDKKHTHGRAHAMPADWQVPAVADLSPKAQALAEQWPNEIYEAEAEGFVSYWITSGQKKTDWRMTWVNRIIARHDAVMRYRKLPASDSSAKDFDLVEQINANPEKWRGSG